MTNNPTLAAFLRLRVFAASDLISPLDRLTAETAAAWLAHATSYGITADDRLLREIADPDKIPVGRAMTLTRALIKDLAAASLPLSSPFQAVDLLYSDLEEEGASAANYTPFDRFEGTFGDEKCV